MIATRAVWLSNALSACLTGLGFFGFLAPTLGDSLSWVHPLAGTGLAMLLSGGISFVVQSNLNGSWREVFLGRSGLAVGLLAVFFTSLSFLGGAGGTVWLDRALALAAQRQAEQGLPTIDALDELATEVRRGAREALDVSDALADLARREADFGGTCVNDPNPSDSCGPICRMRQRQADQAEVVAVGRDALAAEAASLATRMSLATGSDQQAAIYAEARKLATDPRFREAPRALQSIAAEYGTELRDGERTFVCEDPATATRLTAAAATLSVSPELPLIAPREVSVSTADAMACVVALLGEAVGLGRACSRDVVHWGHLGAAAAVELLTLALLALPIAVARRWGAAPTALDRRRAGLRTPSGPERLHAAWLTAAAARLLVDCGRRGRLLAVPTDPDHPARADGLRLVDLFDLGPAICPDVPTSIFRDGAFGSVDLHRWTAEADSELRRAHLWEPEPPVHRGGIGWNAPQDIDEE